MLVFSRTDSYDLLIDHLNSQTYPFGDDQSAIVLKLDNINLLTLIHFAHKMT